MGIYSEYIDKKMPFEALAAERKKHLKRISEFRGRDIIVYASDSNKGNGPVAILPADLLPFKDQLSFINSNEVDLIIETPGGVAETVEDMVELIRSKHEKLGVIIPGSAKSAGTIFAMAGDEILMSDTSSLGPIDAQIIANGKRFSADAFLDGLRKIKEEIAVTGKLNPAYIPMLQNISPGEIQHFENAQNFSRILVKNWLSKYKFKYWETHESTGLPVLPDEKTARAEEIANKLCKHSDWLTHGRSIRIKEFKEMRLQIADYSTIPELNDAIERYYTLLRITFDNTGIYKIFETCNSQIYQSVSQPAFAPIPLPQIPVGSKAVKNAIMNFNCPKCQKPSQIQLNFQPNVPLAKGNILYPKNDIFVCGNCGIQTNIAPLRLQVEAQTGQKVVL